MMMTIERQRVAFARMKFQRRSSEQQQPQLERSLASKHIFPFQLVASPEYTVCRVSSYKSSFRVVNVNNGIAAR